MSTFPTTEDYFAREYIKEVGRNSSGFHGRKPESLSHLSDKQIEEFASNPSIGFMPDAIDNIQGRRMWESDLSKRQTRVLKDSVSDGAVITVIIVGGVAMSAVAFPKAVISAAVLAAGIGLKITGVALLGYAGYGLIKEKK